MPVLGLTMEEGTVAEWLKHEGEAVRKDEPLLTVEMDKGTVEVPAPASGVLWRIVVQTGTTVPVRTVIAEIGEPGEVPSPAASPSAGPAGGPGDLPRVEATTGEVAMASHVGAADGQPAPTARDQVKPLNRIRRLTAERMAASAQATARVTLFLEADFSEAVRFRRQLEPEFARLGVPKLPWDAVVARAAALALAEHRVMLAQWVDGEGLRQAEEINIGIAVTLEPEGLVVPVL